MRGVLTLLVVFGAVAVVYALHWARRASSAAADASRIFQETGSITATAKQLYREQALPDQVRLSRRQQEFVALNFAEFQRLYATAIDETAAMQLRKWGADLGRRPSQEEASQVGQEFFALSSLLHAKIYCTSKGIK